MFWGIQLFGLVIPVLLMLFRNMRRPVPMLVISIIMLIASWFKRLMIVIPPQAHPYLPVQDVPVQWIVYKPTLIEIMVTTASILLVLIIITILSKLFPVISIWEMVEDETKRENKEV
jgi:molybdopterin-containing oxidoreductase family membrane subunit